VAVLADAQRNQKIKNVDQLTNANIEIMRFL